MTQYIVLFIFSRHMSQNLCNYKHLYLTIYFNWFTKFKTKLDNYKGYVEALLKNVIKYYIIVC